MTAQVHQTNIPALDGFQLATTLYEPNQNSTNTVITINAATGVPRRFYRHFAQFLAERGFSVVTYDYRGTGESRPKSLRGFQARMRDWAELDMAGVIEWVYQHYEPGSLVHIGHSFGGQGVGLLPNHDKIEAMVTMSAQSGYWGLQPDMEKYRVWLFVHLVFPFVSHLFGYFPWSKLSAGEDLSKGVALEWSRWCRSPNYLLGDSSLTSLRNFAHFTAPILAYSFSDDVWGTARSVKAMMGGYTRATVTYRHVSPQEAEMKQIGHLGFFRPQAELLWRETLEWLQQQLEPGMVAE